VGGVIAFGAIADHTRDAVPHQYARDLVDQPGKEPGIPLEQRLVEARVAQPPEDRTGDRARPLDQRGGGGDARAAAGA
jgi:hypothetical protein